MRESVRTLAARAGGSVGCAGTAEPIVARSAHGGEYPTEKSVRTLAAASAVKPFLRSAISLAFLCAVLSLGGCWDDGPVEVEEPLELILGSSELNGGQIVTDFDFGVPVPVEFNTEVGGFSIYSATVPGFVALGSRDLAQSPFGVPDGTPIGMRITEIDPEVQIVFSTGLLSEVGDEVEIGESPFDLHPTWQLSFPPGATPAPRFVSFVLTTTASEYRQSDEYTLTIEVDVGDNED